MTFSEVNQREKRLRNLNRRVKNALHKLAQQLNSFQVLFVIDFDIKRKNLEDGLISDKILRKIKFSPTFL